MSRRRWLFWLTAQAVGVVLAYVAYYAIGGWAMVAIALGGSMALASWAFRS